MNTNTPRPIEKIFDWKSNEVKIGMTIYFVRTKPSILEFGRMGMMIPQTGETIWLELEEAVEERRKREVWELGEPMEVVWRQERLCVMIKVEDNPNVEQITFPIHSMFGEKPTIAIKGISDIKTTINE